MRHHGVDIGWGALGGFMLGGSFVRLLDRLGIGEPARQGSTETFVAYIILGATMIVLAVMPWRRRP